MGSKDQDASKTTAGIGGAHDTVREGSAAGGEPGPLPAGVVVAGRFRIVRRLGGGGMGDVYEAEDLELGTVVALKSIRPDRVNAASLERFKREILLARRVTHPNICRTFDLFVERRPGAEPLLVIAMERLDGPTLARFLRDRGALDIKEALPIAVQLCRGLAAAHLAGVVHRDLKSSNVMLTTGGPASEPGQRAVITDFGIARAGDDEVPLDRLTASGQIIGTPAYVAPEQVRGDRAGPRADIYSLGVVLFEMVTGEQPFQGRGPLATAVKRLEEPTPSPAARRPGLDDRWNAAIMKCLALSPDDRFQSANEVEKALVATRTGRDPGRRRRLGVAVSAAAGLAALLALAWPRPDRAPIPSPDGESLVQSFRPTVAVVELLPPADLAESWLGTALREMLAAELAGGGGVRVVAPGSVEMPWLGVDPARPLATETIELIAERRGWDALVGGRYSLAGSAADRRLALELVAWDARSGDRLVEVIEEGPLSELPRLASRAAGRLGGAIGWEAPSEVESGALLPMSLDGAKRYAEGLDALRRSDPTMARERLLEAVDLEPGFSLAWVALAKAWKAAGYDERAREAAEIAESHAGDLPREQRLVVEVERHRLANDWARAEEIQRALVTFFPDNPEYGLDLARIQTRAGRPEAARESLVAVRQRGGPMAFDPRVDLLEAGVALRLDEYEAAARSAAAALATAEARGEPLNAARAQLLLAQVRRRRGETEGALELYRTARATFATAGDVDAVADTLVSEAIVRRRQGALDEAEALYDRALAVYLQAGNVRGQATVMLNRANLRSESGQTDDAIVLYEQVLATYREIESSDGIALASNNLGSALLDRGRVDEAIDHFEVALEAYRAAGSKGGEGTVLIGLGTALLDRGALAEAAPWFEAARRLFEEIEDLYGEGIATNNLGRIARRQGDLAVAHDRHREALEIFQELDAPAMQAHALFGLGEVAREQGALDEARRRHEAALDIRIDLGLRSDEAKSRAALDELIGFEGGVER